MFLGSKLGDSSVGKVPSVTSPTPTEKPGADWNLHLSIPTVLGRRGTLGLASQPFYPNW